jgi:hypothetical protein
MLSVEDLPRDVIAALREKGELDNTYIFFASDNGFHLGQHRMTQGKRTAYEEDVRVPLIVRGPGVPAGRALKHRVLNNDFVPTFARLAGVTPPSFVEGKSMVPLLDTSPPTVSHWRKGILTENWRTEAEGGTSDAPPTRPFVPKIFVGRVRQRGARAVRSAQRPLPAVLASSEQEQESGTKAEQPTRRAGDLRRARVSRRRDELTKQAKRDPALELG